MDERTKCNGRWTQPARAMDDGKQQNPWNDKQEFAGFRRRSFDDKTMERHGGI